MTTLSNKIIAIDGHSSCGKSTVAKQIAKQLGYIYVDSGAMYRAITLFAMRKGWIVNGVIDVEALREAIQQIEISFVYNSDIQKAETFLNGENVENEIRQLEVSNQVSGISALDFVRTRLVELQRKLGEEKSIVMDGRDIGTVVFPNANVKLFMTASAQIRAERRYKELTEKGDKVSFEEVLENVEKRDFIDQNRKVSPLRKADDAIEIDNSNMTREEQMTLILDILKQNNC